MSVRTFFFNYTFYLKRSEAIINQIRLKKQQKIEKLWKQYCLHLRHI